MIIKEEIKMTVKNLRKTNVTLSIISTICFIIFSILGDKLEGNTFLISILLLMVLSCILSVFKYNQDKGNLSTNNIAKEQFKEIFSYNWKNEKSTVILYLIEIAVMVYSSLIYSYGILIIPFIILLIFLFIEKSIENYIK
jgi:hypothetical protein